MAVSDKIRAAVYVRDHALCSFSGKALWVLDYGATPFWQMDWVDHVHPASRGGMHSVDNLVCASYFYNSKKSNNSRDRTYLFYAGKPTYEFSYVFGQISETVANNIHRFSVLNTSDWYFNRALANILINLGDRLDDCENKKVRRRDYWCDSAWKKLQAWQKFTAQDNVPSLEKRRLVPMKKSPDIRIMLSLRRASSLQDVLDIADDLYPFLRANSRAWDQFVYARDHATRRQRLMVATRNTRVSPVVLSAMRHNMGFLQDSTGPMVVEL